MKIALQPLYVSITKQVLIILRSLGGKQTDTMRVTEATPTTCGVRKDGTTTHAPQVRDTMAPTTGVPEGKVLISIQHQENKNNTRVCSTKV